MRIKWDAETVVLAIRFIHERGVPLNTGFVTSHWSALVNQSYKYFGGWKQAVEAAGLLDALPRRNKWSKEIIVTKIRQLGQCGEPLNNYAIKKSYGTLYTVSCQYFGSWGEAVEAAGIEYAAVRKLTMRKWSKTRVVAEIRQRHELGLPTTGTAVSKEDIGLWEAAERYFGRLGYSKARVLAGLQPSKKNPLLVRTGKRFEVEECFPNKKAVLQEIRRLYKAGVSLHVSAMQADPLLSSLMETCRRFFGTYREAIRTAGLNYEKILQVTQWSSPKIIAEIRRLDRKGLQLSPKYLQDHNYTLYGAGCRHFGSWDQALEAAGIPYRKHLQKWSTLTWVRRLDPDEYKGILSSSERHRLKPRGKS